MSRPQEEPDDHRTDGRERPRSREIGEREQDARRETDLPPEVSACESADDHEETGRRQKRGERLRVIQHARPHEHRRDRGDGECRNPDPRSRREELPSDEAREHDDAEYAKDAEKLDGVLRRRESGALCDSLDLTRDREEERWVVPDVRLRLRGQPVLVRDNVLVLPTRVRVVALKPVILRRVPGEDAERHRDDCDRHEDLRSGRAGGRSSEAAHRGRPQIAKSPTC